MSRHGVKLRDAKTLSLFSWSFQSRTGDDSHPNHSAREKVHFCFFSERLIFYCFFVCDKGIAWPLQNNQAI